LFKIFYAFRCLQDSINFHNNIIFNYNVVNTSYQLIIWKSIITQALTEPYSRFYLILVFIIKKSIKKIFLVLTVMQYESVRTYVGIIWTSVKGVDLIKIFFYILNVVKNHWIDITQDTNYHLVDECLSAYIIWET